jgi:TRAP-type C4-dicarboxylate transport system permease small subunit
VNAACVTVACVLIALMSVLTLWEAITRYFFRQPAMWTYPIVSYMLLYSIYLSVAYALQRGRHVGVDFVLEMLSERPRRALERVGHVLGLLFTVVFLYESYRVFSRHLREGQRDISALSLPLAPASIVLVTGLALLAVTYVFVAIDSFLRPPGVPTIQDEELSRGATVVGVE